MTRTSVCLFLMTLIAGSLSHAAELTEAEFRALHAKLQPDVSAMWRSIPWRATVLSAQQAAAQQQKPIFIWAMDGHPLGCT
ncbi:MAG: hypothetical protein R3C49_01840 [Planctomycetaceae bacterium]